MINIMNKWNDQCYEHDRYSFRGDYSDGRKHGWGVCMWTRFYAGVSGLFLQKILKGHLVKKG